VARWHFLLEKEGINSLSPYFEVSYLLPFNDNIYFFDIFFLICLIVIPNDSLDGIIKRITLCSPLFSFFSSFIPPFRDL